MKISMAGFFRAIPQEIQMDLVAPSGNVNLTGDVRTTDRMNNNGYETGNYTTRFGGTSSACPQASGVAALMLSVNPNLTETQVKTILQQTATDMGSSGFDNTFGYGRVNAQAALIQVRNTITISGPTLICSSGTFTVNNVPPGCTIYWDKSSNITLPTDRTTNPIIATANGSGAGWVQATVSSSCGSITLPQYTVWVGNLPTPTISGIAVVKCGYEVPFHVDNTSKSYSQSFIWDSDILAFYPDDEYKVYASGYVNGRGTISCTVNTCGTPATGYRNVSVTLCGRSLLISPNPASDNIQVSMITEDETNIDDMSVSSNIKESETYTNYLVSIIDLFGKKVYTSKTETKVFTIPLSMIKDGTYFVTVTDNKSIWQGTLIVKH